MSQFHLSLQFSLELDRFHNIDLYDRGYYEIRCGIKQAGSVKLAAPISCQLSYSTPIANSDCSEYSVDQAWVDQTNQSAMTASTVSVQTTVSQANSQIGNTNSSSSSSSFKCPAASKLVQVLYKDQLSQLEDAFLFRIDCIVDAETPLESLNQLSLLLVVELWFTDEDTNESIRAALKQVSTREFKIDMDCTRGFHCYLPCVFDYYYLSCVEIMMHASITGFGTTRLRASPSYSNLAKAANSESFSSLSSLHQQNPEESLTALQEILVSRNQTPQSRRKSALTVHNNVCHLLLSAYESLQATLKQLIELLPPIQQMQLDMVDCSSRLASLSEQIHSCAGVDELVRLATGHMTALVTDLQLLWDRFRSTVCLVTEALDHFARQYHSQRVKRFAEGYFRTEKMVGDLFRLQEASPYEQLANVIRSSPYHLQLVPLPLHCSELDGEPATLPLIFEDVYPPHVGAPSELPSSTNTDGASGGSEQKPRLTCVSAQKALNTSLRTLSKTDAPPHPQSTQAQLIGFRKLENGDQPVFNLGGDPEPDGTDSVADASDTGIQSRLSVRGLGTLSTASSLPDLHRVSESGVDSVSETGSHEVSLMEALGAGSDNASDIGHAHTKSLSELKLSKLVNTFSETTLANVQRKEAIKREMALTQLDSILHLYSDFRSSSLASTDPPFRDLASPECFGRSSTRHLVVCVHGLEGNSGDLRLVRVFLTMALPNERFDFLMSERNQNDTFADIRVMRDNLVEEILSHLNSISRQPTHVSFIGHSLGTIIIRAAIADQRLNHLRKKFHTFLSLSGPHLGALYNTSSLVNAGMWVIQKMKKSGSILQLKLKDNSDPRQTFLYDLSSASGLESFANVLLVSSPQDRYVPYHSSRVELASRALRDTGQMSAVYMEMVSNLLQKLSKVLTVRYDVHHSFPSSTNALIGRAAHIAVLDSEVFLDKFISVSAAKYFSTAN